MTASRFGSTQRSLRGRGGHPVSELAQSAMMSRKQPWRHREGGDLALQHHGRQISGEDDAADGSNVGQYPADSARGGVAHDLQPVRVDVAVIRSASWHSRP